MLVQITRVNQILLCSKSKNPNVAATHACYTKYKHACYLVFLALGLNGKPVSRVNRSTLATDNSLGNQVTLRDGLLIGMGLDKRPNCTIWSWFDIHSHAHIHVWTSTTSFFCPRCRPSSGRDFYLSVHLVRGWSNRLIQVLGTRATHRPSFSITILPCERSTREQVNFMNF